MCAEGGLWRVGAVGLRRFPQQPGGREAFLGGTPRGRPGRWALGRCAARGRDEAQAEAVVCLASGWLRGLVTDGVADVLLPTRFASDVPKELDMPSGKEHASPPVCTSRLSDDMQGEELAVDQGTMLTSIFCLLILQPRSVLLFHIMSLTLGMNSL